MNFALAFKPASLALLGLGCCLAVVSCVDSDTKSNTNDQGGSGAESGEASAQGQSGSTAAGGQTTAGGQTAASGASGAGAAQAGASGASTAQAGAGGASAAQGGASNAGGGSSGGASGGTGVLKIMAIGDSITRATCWRALLWQELNQAHPGQFDLVGTLMSDNGCTPVGYDEDNQGYSSSLVTEVVAGITSARTCDPFCPKLSDFTAAFTAKMPDVILMHFGTNDVWNNIAASDILTAYSAVIDTARGANPNVKFLVAQIIPMNVTDATCSGCSCATCGTGITTLDSMIPNWAAGKTTAASPITVVDQYTGFDAVADTRDGVHPNNTTGSQKMADKWNAALTPLLGASTN